MTAIVLRLIFVLSFALLYLPTRAAGASIEKYEVIPIESGKSVSEDFCFEPLVDQSSISMLVNPSPLQISLLPFGTRSVLHKITISGNAAESFALTTTLPLVDRSVVCSRNNDVTLEPRDIVRHLELDKARAYPIHRVHFHKAGEIEVYVVGISSAGAIFPYKLIDPSQLLSIESYDEKLYFLLVGALVSMILYNSFLLIRATSFTSST